MKRKYILFTIGGKRVLLTPREFHNAVDTALTESKQHNYLFGFSIVEMTEDQAGLESIRHDEAELILKYK